MRSSAEGAPRDALARHLAVAALALLGALSGACDGCERPESAKPEGAARPLPFEVERPPSASGAPTRAANVGCEPGAHRCVGEQLEACDPSSGGWTRVNVCQSAAHCNGMLKQCLVDPCILGEHQCDGRHLQQCQANGWTTIRDCGSPEACDAPAGNCR